MNGLYAQGCADYERNDFASALNAFNRAIARTKDPGVQLLDKRAACHMKMGNLMAALKDTKAIVATARTHYAGYLRAGAILNKMGKQTIALQVYAKGLQNVKAVGQGYTALRSAHDRLADIVFPKDRFDPMTRFPAELAEMILEYLSFRQRVNACRVSKQWAAFIRSCHDLWRHLDFSGSKKMVKSAFISKAINNVGTKINAASLHRVYDLPKTLAALLNFCQIQELNMWGVGFLEPCIFKLLSTAKTPLRTLRLLKPSEAGEDTLMRLLPTVLPSLSVFDCSGLKLPRDIFRDWNKECLFLRELTLHGEHMGSINPAIKVMPALRKLHAFFDSMAFGSLDLSSLQYLEDLTITLKQGASQQILVPRSLKLLSYRQLNGGPRSPMWSSNGLDDGAGGSSYLPHLQSLQYRLAFSDLSQVLRFLSPDVNVFESPTAAEASKLHSLSVPHAEFSSLENLHALAEHPRLTELRHLDLTQTSWSWPTVDLPKVLAKVCKGLKSLQLDRSSVTGADLKAGLMGPALEELSIRECAALSHDAVTWARSLGVKVVSNGEVQLMNASRVRWGMH